MAWPMVDLGELVSQRNNWVDHHQPDVTYLPSGRRARPLGTRSQACEASLQRRGSQDSRPPQRCRYQRKSVPAVAEIDARNGAFGLVPDRVGRCTGQQPLTSLYRGRRRVLRLTPDTWSGTAEDQRLRGPSGESSARFNESRRSVLKEQKLLNYGIPLPPFEEQRRIVARLDRVAMRIEERRQVLMAAEREISALLRKAFDKAAEGADLSTDGEADRSARAAARGRSAGQELPRTGGPIVRTRHFPQA